MKAFLLYITLLIIPICGHSQNIWFDDIVEPIVMTRQTAESVLIDIYNYLNVKKNLTNLDIYSDSKPRIVFLSLGKKDKTATVAIGRGNGLKLAIENALKKIDTNTLSSTDTLIKLDIVKNVTKVMTSENTRMDLYEPSLYGIAFDKESEYALLPGQILANNIFTENNKIVIGKLHGILKNRKNSKNKSLWILYRYNTNSYIYENNTFYSLYRDHKVVNSVDPERLLLDAFTAADYLLKSINSDGSFVYSYDPSSNKVSEKYNILRHAGTIYSLLQLYEINKKPEILSGVEITLNYMLKHVESCPPPAINNTLCLIHNNKVKLGANALAIIALSKHAELTGSITNSDTIFKLGQWILDTMANNGSFTIHKQYHKSGKISKFISGYYPGEATLALLALHHFDNNKKWLNAASIAIDHIIQQQKPQTAPHDHWLLYSLTEIYRVKPERKYLTHSQFIAEEIMRSQNVNTAQPDWDGSYNMQPESAATATRTEGLIAAYELSKFGNDIEYSEQLLKNIISGLIFQQQTQYDEVSSMYFTHPSKAINAFKRSLVNPEIRIDYIQHNISSYIGFSKIIK